MLGLPELELQAVVCYPMSVLVIKHKSFSQEQYMLYYWVISSALVQILSSFTKATNIVSLFLRIELSSPIPIFYIIKHLQISSIIFLTIEAY